MSQRLLTWVGLSGVLLFVAGCAAARTGVDIPTGHWSGTGQFIAEHWSKESGEAVIADKLEHRSYPTSLVIEPVTNGDPNELRMTIVSQRGPSAIMDGDRTHIVLLLKPNPRNEGQPLALYRITRFGISLDAGPVQLDAGPKGPTHASCLRVDGDLVLRIEYMPGFVDTFRFRDDKLYKDGVYAAGDKEGLLHWSEVLRRSP